MTFAKHLANIEQPAALVADEVAQILANALSIGLPAEEVLAGISIAHIQAMKAFNALDLVPALLRKEADRLDRMHALDTAAANRVRN